MLTVELSPEEVIFLVALLTADRQTALQLLAAEHAYNAIEAAYVMQEAEELYGRDSKELAEAFQDYQKAVNNYYRLSGTGKNDFWTSFCEYNPSCAECLVYDT